MSFPVDINKTPLEEFKEAIALQIGSEVMFYNPASCIVCTYGITDYGYSFHVTRYTEKDFMKYFNFIWTNKKSRELSLKDFNEFVNRLNVLQEQATLLRPLVTFDNYIESIREALDLR